MSSGPLTILRPRAVLTLVHIPPRIQHNLECDRPTLLLRRRNWCAIVRLLVLLPGRREPLSPHSDLKDPQGENRPQGLSWHVRGAFEVFHVLVYAVNRPFQRPDYCNELSFTPIVFRCQLGVQFISRVTFLVHYDEGAVGLPLLVSSFVVPAAESRCHLVDTRRVFGEPWRPCCVSHRGRGRRRRRRVGFRDWQHVDDHTMGDLFGSMDVLSGAMYARGHWFSIGKTSSIKPSAVVHSACGFVTWLKWPAGLLRIFKAASKLHLVFGSTFCCLLQYATLWSQEGPLGVLTLLVGFLQGSGAGNDFTLDGRVSTAVPEGSRLARVSWHGTRAASSGQRSNQRCSPPLRVGGFMNRST